MKPCLIISGGQPSPIPETYKTSYVIACDQGCAYALAQGVRPDLVIGDFDSYSGPLPTDIEILRFPPEKDDTDTMMALKIALERGFRRFEICCALGGRLDHLYANLQTMVYAVEHGASCSITETDSWATVLKNGSICLPRREGFSLSVFSVSDLSQGVSLEGVKYPLTDASLSNTFPLGVSNEWTADTAAITVGEGTLLLLLSRL